MKKNIILIYVLMVSLLVGCSSHRAPVTAAAAVSGYLKYVLPPLPTWTDKYLPPGQESAIFFNMSALVHHLGLTRLQAVELQNHFRDLTAKGSNPQDAFDKALEKVRAFDFESRLSPAKLKEAPFIVAIDIDETLLQQYYTKWKNGPDYYDYIIHVGRDTRGVSMTPGWKVLLRKIKELGGLVVIFSANTDDTVWTIVNTVTIDGVKLADYVDGIMSNSYLILRGKYEWVPKGKTGSPVVNPSKDLMPLDKCLDKVILIDDNPTRVIQNNRLRVPRKYQADIYLGSTDKVIVDAYNKQLTRVAWEIAESYEYCKNKPDVSFAQAFLPYSQLGQIALTWLVQSKALSYDDAVAYIRSNPKKAMDQKF